MKAPTIGSLLDFVLDNRKDKVFKGYSKEQVAGMIIEGLSDGLLYYALDANNYITGMILAKKEDDQTLWIEENLAMTLSNLRQFAIKAKQQFPSYSFEGFKCNRSRKFNKLFNKLTK